MTLTMEVGRFRIESSAIVGHHGATVARDLLFFLCGDNLNLIGSQTKNLKPFCGRGSNAIAMLSDAASEDQKIRATQQRHVRPDGFSYGHGKDIQSQPRF